VEQVALSDHEGTAVLRMPRSAPGYATMEPDNHLEGKVALDEGVEEYEVSVRRLDQFGLTGVAFLKIDVEGHELSFP
jgi:FkbM family methyltransferase